MSAVIFTPRQLDLELALLLRNLYINLCYLVGTEKSSAAFGLNELNQHPGDLLPEEFPIEEFPAYSAIHKLANFVNNQVGFTLGSFVYETEAINALLYLLTPELEKKWSEAAISFPEEHKNGITPLDNVDEEFSVGIHYRGLIKKIIALAEARHKVDDGYPLTLSEMALLVGFNERSVMSAANRNEFISEMRDGRRWVESDEALKWMTPRGYKPTVYAAKNDIPGYPDAYQDEMYFVPVAADKTFFSPECRIGKGYTIGQKGNEIKIEDYFEALHALSKMPAPYWRRANSEGNWGIVRGIEWHRIGKVQLDNMLKQKEFNHEK